MADTHEPSVKDYINFDGVSNEKKKQIISLADTYKDAVEAFGLIHLGSKSIERPYEVAIAKLGIQQARLLAWGDMVCIWDTSDLRDVTMDSEPKSSNIIKELKTITELLQGIDHAKQTQIYGLKATKKSNQKPEPTLDFLRLQSFREKYQCLHPLRGSVLVTSPHWKLNNLNKFLALISEIKIHVENLVNLFDNEEKVNTAVKADIRALGWHPIFNSDRVAVDASKLRLIEAATKEWYPDYALSTIGALSSINLEWNQNLQDAMERMRDFKLSKNGEKTKLKGEKSSTTNKNDAESTNARSKSVSVDYSHRQGLFSQLNPKSWRRSSEVHNPKGQDHPRSQSTSAAEDASKMISKQLNKAESRFVSDLPDHNVNFNVTNWSPPETLGKTPKVSAPPDLSEYSPLETKISRHDALYRAK